MILVPSTQQSLPLIKPKQSLKVLFEHEGLLREALWLKYTNKGDFLVSSRVWSNRKMRGLARTLPHALNFSDVSRVLSTSDKRPHDYLTLHPARIERGFQAAVVNGPAGLSNTSFDLSAIEDIREIIVVLLTSSEKYPLSFNSDIIITFGNVYRDARIPEFHIYATAIKDGISTDYAVPFIRNQSADFIIETKSLVHKLMLIQIRLFHQYDGLFAKDHAFLVPTQSAIEA